MKPSHAIGMFDSGIGGLTVMKQIVHKLPYENVVYFGDTARFPYGEKSRETIIKYSIENATFLMEQNIKMLVIPCNTASAFAAETLRQIFNLPVVDVIEPGVEKIVAVTTNKKIGVLGTKGTINSGVYQKEIQQRLPHATVIAIPCPLFAPLVEEKFINHPATRLIVKEYLSPLKGKGIDTLLLGCTHYPLLRTLIQEEIGEDVTIVDSATTCAEKVASLLDHFHLHNPAKNSPIHHYFVSDDPDKFRHIGLDFLGMPIAKVTLPLFKINSLQ